MNEASTRRVMLVGQIGAGKSTLIRTLSHGALSPSRAMSVQFLGEFINTPGEFLENRRFYHALITAAAQCHILLLLQDATRKSSLFPPRFAAMFNRRVVGVATKTDAERADAGRAEKFLRNAGAGELVRVSARSGEGMEALRGMLG